MPVKVAGARLVRVGEDVTWEWLGFENGRQLLDVNGRMGGYRLSLPLLGRYQLENAAVGHPAVAEAACVGMYHPKWDERPVLFVVKKEGAELSADDVIEHLRPLIAKWWLPDAVEFIDEIPHTATGKISKKDLRDQFADYKLPGVEA